MGALLFIRWIDLSLFVVSFVAKSKTSCPTNGFRYGQAAFSVKLDTKSLASIFFKTACLALVKFVLFGTLMAGVAIVTGNAEEIANLVRSLMEGGFRGADRKNPITSDLSMFIGLSYLCMLRLSSAVFAYYYARKRTYVFANTLLDKDISFSSTLSARKYARVTISNFNFVIVTLGLTSTWTRIRVARLLASHTFVDTSLGLDSYVTQKQTEESSLGELIGEAFDADIGIGF